MPFDPRRVCHNNSHPLLRRKRSSFVRPAMAYKCGRTPNQIGWLLGAAFILAVTAGDPARSARGQNLDLRGSAGTGSGIFSSTGEFTYANVLTDVDSAFHFNSTFDPLDPTAGDAKLTARFFAESGIMGQGGLVEDRVGGELVVGANNMFTLVSTGGDQITLPKRTVLNDGILASTGDQYFRIHNRAGDPFIATFSGTGIILGQITTGEGARFEPASTALNVNRSIDFGSRGGRLLTGTMAIFKKPVTLAGGIVNFIQNVGDKQINMLAEEATLTGHGVIDAIGAYGKVTVSGGNLTLGAAFAPGESHITDLVVEAGRTATLASLSSPFSLHKVDLQGARIEAPNGVKFVTLFGQGATSKLSGTINSGVTAAAEATLTATGDLRMGRPNIERGIDIAGQLNVGSHRVTISDQSRVLIGSASLDGGELFANILRPDSAANGLQFKSGATLSGNGVVIGNFVVAPATIAPAGTLVSTRDLDVGRVDALVLSAGRAQFNGPAGAPPEDLTTISIDGGRIDADNGIHLGVNSELIGHGIVNASVSAAGDEGGHENAARIVLDGDLTIGKFTSDGFSFGGHLDVGSHLLTVVDSTAAQFGKRTTLDGGQVIAEQGIQLSAGDTISGRGAIHGRITGAEPGAVTATGTYDMSNLLPLTMNDGDFLTVLTTTTLDVGDESPQDVFLNGGELRIPGGFVIKGSQLTTGTSLFGPVQGEFTYTNLFASADVTIGDASRSDGVRLSPETWGNNVIDVGSHDVVLLDSDGIEVSLVSLHGGSIRSDNGFLPIGSARVEGHGLVFGDLTGFDVQPTAALPGLLNNLNVGNGTLTVVSTDFSRVSNLNMNAGGRLVATSNAIQQFVFDGDQAFAGTVEGTVGFFPNSTIRATGNLTVGDATDSFGFVMGQNSLLEVGNHTVTLLDQGRVDVDEITLAGGEIRSAHGFQKGSGITSPSISGYGVIRGDVAPSVPVVATGPLTLTNPLDVAGDKVELLSTERPVIAADIQIDGGSLIIPLGMTGSGNPTLSGSAIIRTAGLVDGIELVGNAPLPAITSNLAIGADTVLLLSSTPARFRATTTIAGGTLQTSSSGVSFELGAGLTGFGDIQGQLNTSVGSVIKASGGELAVGDPDNPFGVFMFGTIDVGSDSIVLRDSDAADIGNAILAGGSLKAANGIHLEAGETISGHGFIHGIVSGEGTLDPTGPVTLPDTLAVGGDVVTLLTTSHPIVSSDITLAGGRLQSTSTDLFIHSSGGTLSGYGVVALPYRSSSSTVITASGDLTIGDASRADGVDINGTLHVGSHQVTLLDTDVVPLGRTTTIAGGTIEAVNGLEIGADFHGPFTLSGHGIIRGQITGNGILQPNAAMILESESLFAGNDSITIVGTSVAGRGALININGGTIATTEADIRLEQDSLLQGNGTVDASLVVDASSEVRAESGRLTLGAADMTGEIRIEGDLKAGFEIDIPTVGTILTNSRVILRSQDPAMLGGNVVLNNGSRLEAVNGIELTSAGRLSVLGAESEPAATPADVNGDYGNASIGGPFVNRGEVHGPLLESGDRIQFEGPVSGGGVYTGAVRFLDEVSPDNDTSIALEHGEFADTARLLIEVAGPSAGSEFDALPFSGTAALDGEILVDLLSEYVPAASDTYSVITAGTVSGEFANATDGSRLSTLGGEGWFLVSYDASGVVLSEFLTVQAASDFDGDGVVDGGDFLIWQTNFGLQAAATQQDGDADFDGDVDGDDFLAWQAAFGTSAGSGNSSPRSVPEPSTAMLLVATLLVCLPAAASRQRVGR